MGARPPTRLQLWEGPNLYDLTRERRAERKPPTIYATRYGVRQDHTAVYNEWITNIEGLIATDLTRALMTFQRGRCYLCTKRFGRKRPATREHVTPKALGGVNARNVLLACKPCNGAKSDRAPTLAELELLAAFNTHMDAVGGDPTSIVNLTLTDLIGCD